MARSFLLACLVFAANILSSRAVYNVARDYSGDSFFDLFDYYGNTDNTTGGSVYFLGETDAIAQALTYVSTSGTAIVKVDNVTTVAAGATRK